jgi:hypothetical protein
MGEMSAWKVAARRAQKLQRRSFLKRCLRGAEPGSIRALLCGGVARLQASAERAGARNDAVAERQLRRIHRLEC